ncbi:MAG TPA: Fe-S protein assembly co-chaperone HscB [Candidatus Binatia bacterium]|nr:Fe-S protein assembly co-chaperone HscB [Candidatus Binatia bacterium]
MDYFEVFGLPRKLALDAAALQERFYALSRQVHPDFHAGKPPTEQAAALEASARLNAAYRALRDPIARIEYLIRLEEGRPTREGSAERPAAPPELLAELFEVQEALAEARAGGLGEEARRTLAAERDRLRVRLEEETARLTGSLTTAWDGAASAEERARVLRELKETLARRTYLATVIEDLEQALGGAEETGEHVAHHRH